MNHDPLDEALRALREEGGEPAAPRAAEVTRDRIMFALHREQRRRLSRLSVVLPLVAVLAGSTVWAAGTGRLTAAVRAVQALVAPGSLDAPADEATPAVPARGGAARSPGAEAPPAPASVAVEPVADVPPSAEGEPRAVPAPAVSGAAGASAPGAGGAGPHGAAGAGGAPADRPRAEPRADALYREAHRLHFGGGAPAAALAAWDGYLREAPRGRFATEARYNRALTLVRLGRKAEARTALEPFARARAGSYRQAEAAALLAALGGR